MNIYIAKKTFRAHSILGDIIVAQGQMFYVKGPEELPHPLGKDPSLDDNNFTERDTWAIKGEWKEEYDIKVLSKAN